MDKMKELVCNLLTSDSSPVPALQLINETLLKEYQLSLGSGIQVLPKEVEIYYVNRKVRPPYIDGNMQCMLDPKINMEIWDLQSGRFGQIYCHKKGLGGLDICLSDSADYALCCTIKAAEINGEVYWSPLKVRNTVFALIGEQEGISDKDTLMERMNGLHSMPVLGRREHPLTGHVYHLRRRGLRRRDKTVLLPLRSFMDLWNDKLQMNRSQKLNLYLAAHPSANVLDVLRQYNFRYIPSEIKIKYKMDKKTKLYE